MQRPESESAEHTSEIPPMYSPAQLRMLRIAVIAMGVILLLGFGTVIGRIVYLLNNPAGEDIAAVGSRSPSVVAPASIELPKGASVKHLAVSGNRLAVHFEGPTGAGVRIIDLSAPSRSFTLPIVEAPTH